MLMASEDKVARRSAARSEWVRDWPLILTAVIGMSLATVANYSVGQFMAPLENSFGWTRTQILAGVSISSFTMFALSGFMGRAIDRANARVLAIAGVMVCSLSFASFSLVDG